MESNPWFRALIILGVFALALHLGNQLWAMASHFGDIIVVFFLAWLVAFILSPLAHILSRAYGMPRALAASLVYLALFVNVGIVFVLIVPLAVEQLVQLGQRLPTFVAAAQGWVGSAQLELEARGIAVDLPSFYRNSDLAAQIGGLGSSIVTNTISVVGGVASAVFSVVIVLVLSFYLVLDGDRLLARLTALIPASRQLETRFLLDSINRTFGGFLRGTLLIAIVYGIGNAVVMATAGLGYILLASLLASLLMVIPLIGPALAMVLPLLLAAIQGDLTRLAIVLVGLLVLQVLVFNVLTPRVMGQSVGMHPLLVLLALLVGIKQAGLVGAIFGVPVVGVIYAMVRYFVQRKTDTEVVVAAPEPASDEAKGRQDHERLADRVAWVLSAARDWLLATQRLIVGWLRATLGRGLKSYGGRLRSGD
mgnify:CR=1 FL=1